MKKRWWLLEWPNGSQSVERSGPISNTEVRCTEVRLVPVDAVVCAKGTREWAVVMAMRGKKVTHKTHLGNDDNPHWASIIVNHEDMGEWYELPAEEPLKCPACGHTAGTHKYAGKWTVSCSRCQLRFGSGSAYPFNTESEAREAFRKMGGKR